jgi:hypothetical protein
MILNAERVFTKTILRKTWSELLINLGAQKLKSLLPVTKATRPRKKFNSAGSVLTMHLNQFSVFIIDHKYCPLRCIQSGTSLLPLFSILSQ